jgi:hypothetical protein
VDHFAQGLPALREMVHDCLPPVRRLAAPKYETERRAPARNVVPQRIAPAELPL